MTARNDRGAVLLVALAVLGLLAVFGAAFFTLVHLERTASRNYTDSVRARLLARAGVDRAKAELREVAGRRAYSSIYPIAYPDPPARTLPPDVDAWGYAWNDPAGPGKGGLQKGEPRSLLTTSTPSFAQNSGRDLPGHPNCKLIYSGKLGETYPQGADVYRLKVLDAASQINLNHPDPCSLQRMLRNLLRSRFGFDAPTANAIAIRVVEARPSTGYKAKGDIEPIVVATGSGGGLTTDQWLELRDDLTTFSWVDEKVVRPFALDWEADLDPKLDVDSSGSLRSQKPRRELRAQPRSPININTANLHVLTALFAETMADSPAGQFRLSYSSARELAQAIVDRRNTLATAGGGPIKTWEQWNAFVDQLAINWMLPDPGLGAAPQHDLLLASLNNPEFRGDPSRSPLTATLAGPLVSATQGLRDLVKAVANPNTDVTKLGLERNVAGIALDKRSPLVELPHLCDKSDLVRHTTEACFDAMGVYEITSLGLLYDTDLNVAAAQTLQQVVRVYEVFRLTTQQDFETNRTFGYPGNFISITKGGDLDILTRKAGIPESVNANYKAARDAVENGQPIAGFPGLLTYPQYSFVRTPDRNNAGEWAPAPDYHMATWDGHLALSNLQGFVAKSQDFVADFSRGHVSAFKCRAWWDPKDQDPSEGEPLVDKLDTPTHPASAAELDDLVQAIGTGPENDPNGDTSPRTHALSPESDKSLIDDTGAAASTREAAFAMFRDGAGLWPGGVVIAPERTNTKTGKSRVLVYDGRNMDLNLMSGCSIRFWVQPMVDPYLYKREVLFSWVGSKKLATESTAGAGDERQVGFIVTKEVIGREVHIVLRGPSRVINGLPNAPRWTSEWRNKKANGPLDEIHIDVTPPGKPDGAKPWLPHSWHWIAIDFGLNGWLPSMTGNTITIHMSVDGKDAAGNFKDTGSNEGQRLFFRSHGPEDVPGKTNGPPFVAHGHYDGFKILGVGKSFGPIGPHNPPSSRFTKIWWAATKYFFGHYYACDDGTDETKSEHHELTFPNAVAYDPSSKKYVAQRVTIGDRTWDTDLFKDGDVNGTVKLVFKKKKGQSGTAPPAVMVMPDGSGKYELDDPAEWGPDGVKGGEEWEIDGFISWDRVVQDSSHKCAECTDLSRDLHCNEDSRPEAISKAPGEGGGTWIERLMPEYHKGGDGGKQLHCWVVPPADHGELSLPRPTDKEHYCDDCHGCMACCVRGPMWFGAEPESTKNFRSVAGGAGGVQPPQAAVARLEPAFPNEATIAHAVFDNIIIANGSSQRRTDNPAATGQEGSPENRFFEQNLAEYNKTTLKEFGARYERGLGELVGRTLRLGTLSWTAYATQRRAFLSGTGGEQDPRGIGKFDWVSPGGNKLEFDVALFKLRLGSSSADPGYVNAMRTSGPALTDMKGWLDADILLESPDQGGRLLVDANKHPLGVNGLLVDVDPLTGQLSAVSATARYLDGGEGIRFGSEQRLQGGFDADLDGTYTSSSQDIRPEILVLSVRLNATVDSLNQGTNLEEGRTISPILDDVTLTLLPDAPVVLYAEEGVEE